MAAATKERLSADGARRSPTLPEPVVAAAPEPGRRGLHPAVYIFAWIMLSSSVIIFNKWILHVVHFEYPLFLTTWHLSSATIMTQILAHFTPMLDSRHKVPMTPQIYMRAIVPIGVFFSLSLICGNLTYLYLSVSFIQMLKATNSVATLITTWALGVAPVSLKTLGNVSFIVVGVVVASFGEIQFHLLGFFYQVGGILFEAVRLVMVQRLLSSAEFKMDPLVSLYYFAPCCAVMNGVCMLITEAPRMTLADFSNVGYITLLINGLLAFCLNVSAVLLIGKTSALVLTLSGVLKDILLVVASMVIFLDPVTPLQFLGYTMALAGLIYYRLGAEALSQYAQQARLGVKDYRVRHPVVGRVAMGATGVSVVLLLYAMSTLVVPSPYRWGVSQLFHHVGDKTQP